MPLITDASPTSISIHLAEKCFLLLQDGAAVDLTLQHKAGGGTDLCPADKIDK